MNDDQPNHRFRRNHSEQLSEARHYRVEVPSSPEDQVFIAGAPELNRAKTHADTPVTFSELCRRFSKLTAAQLSGPITSPSRAVSTTSLVIAPRALISRMRAI